jgi:hypothetical protein
VRSIEGSVTETHGSIETKIMEGSLQIPSSFQLVNKQFNLHEDGILGQHFLKQTQAQIFYQNRTLNFTYSGVTITKSLRNPFYGSKLTNSRKREGQIRIPLRSESIVRVPAESGS